jgi:zinc transport system substrate-binding protein
MRSILFGGVVATGLAGAIAADVPKVATDIAPVHSLVAQVMDGLGEPFLLIDPGASPHAYALRPSQARALSQADAVFWVGQGLTPWLHHPLESLAGGAVSIALMELPKTKTLEVRGGVNFAAHDHAGHENEQEHGHEDDHAHQHDDDSHHNDGHHDEHGDHKSADHEGHDHVGDDPHGWLDPLNAIAWLEVIASELSRLDPDNAATYAQNAAAARVEMLELVADLKAQMAPSADLRFMVFHDAFHYFESRFGLTAAGAISLSDASDPSAGRVAEARATLAAAKVTCVFTEPQFNPGLIRAVAETGVAVAQIDPLGVAHEIGPDLYGNMMRDLAAGIHACPK